MPSIRLIPIVLFATASLLVLKTAALVQGGGYTIGALYGARAQEAAAPAPAAVADTAAPQSSAKAAQPGRPLAQDEADPADVTGSIAGGKPAVVASNDQSAPTADAPAGAPPPQGQVPSPEKIGRPGPVSPEGDKTSASGERAVLENLQERRRQLEARARELEIREGLLKAAEKRLEARLEELKAKEAELKATMEKKDEAEAARFKSLVAMYESMKPKDAARIFDRLELKVLIEVATHINPRRMSDILAQMSPEVAERLTVELAGRSGSAGAGVAANVGASASGSSVNPIDLPKIEGRPRN